MKSAGRNVVCTQTSNPLCRQVRKVTPCDNILGQFLPCLWFVLYIFARCEFLFLHGANMAEATDRLTGIHHCPRVDCYILAARFTIDS